MPDLKGLSPVKGDTMTAVNMLMGIFKNVGAKEKTEVDKQRSRMGAAAAERTKKSNKAKETGIWIEPDTAELADDALRTTEQVEIRHSGNQFSLMDNDIYFWARKG